MGGSELVDRRHMDIKKSSFGGAISETSGGIISANV